MLVETDYLWREGRYDFTLLVIIYMNFIETHISNHPSLLQHQMRRQNHTLREGKGVSYKKITNRSYDTQYCSEARISAPAFGALLLTICMTSSIVVSLILSGG